MSKILGTWIANFTFFSLFKTIVFFALKRNAFYYYFNCSYLFVFIGHIDRHDITLRGYNFSITKEKYFVATKKDEKQYHVTITFVFRSIVFRIHGSVEDKSCWMLVTCVCWQFEQYHISIFTENLMGNNQQHL